MDEPAPISPTPRRARRTGRVVLALAVLAAVAAGGIAAAVRTGILPPGRLPPALVALLSPPTAPVPQAPSPPAAPAPAAVGPDRLAAADPALRGLLLDAKVRPGLGFARQPAAGPAVLCDVMSGSELEHAVWAPDPVIPGEWTCATDLLQVGGGIEEDPSTVFGFIRGRHRGSTDMIRVSVAFGSERSAAEARAIASRVLGAVLGKAGVRPPEGFLEAVSAGDALGPTPGDWRFAVIRKEGAPRMDVLITAERPAGFVPPDTFAGRGPRLRSDPPPGGTPPGAAPPDAGETGDAAHGVATTPEPDLPPGFEAVGPEDDPLPEGFTEEEAAPAAEPADGEKPIDQITR